MIAAAILHILEEYFLGWLEWARNFISGVTLAQFVVINVLFLILTVLAAIMDAQCTILRSSVFALVLFNALVHIVPTIRQRQFSPGLITALLLCLPLGLLGYFLLLSSGSLTLRGLGWSILTGLGWMSVPFLFQAVRILINK